jgi:hypothetical protein
MEQHISKALIRYVSPDSYYPPPPRNFPPLTFFSFPREIRDKIYQHALVSTSNIIVWKGELESESVPLYQGPRRIWLGHPASRLVWRAVSHKETAASLCTININLLISSKAVGHEAAMVFYNKNTFTFEGDHNWDPVITWLKTIGPSNRNSLATLEVWAKRPDQVWQNPRGERLRHPGGWTMEEIYPRHPYLGTPTAGFKYGCVDNINPVLEEIFVMLGRRTSEKEITIVMRIDGRYPGGGAEPEPMDQCPENSWYSMELPNLLEKFLELHSPPSEEGSVEVIWKGLAYQRLLIAEQDSIKNLGWDMSTSPADNDEMRFWFGSSFNHEDFASYTLRRQNFTGPLITQDPSPYSHVYIFPGINRELYL